MCFAACGAALADRARADVAGLAVAGLSIAAPRSDPTVMAVARVRKLALAPM
jgi:hypothetical protein